MDHYGLINLRLNFETFQNFDADPSDLADTMRTVPDFTDPIQIERIDTHRPSVVSAKSVSVVVNGA